ncbi:MAG: LytTR family DNA-binding domain-containing protein [Lachnospiraceae bacterium]|nr:LytTR family DNA-binding domain-containing protein [Lachnospiraceae bacterium]
MPQTYENHRSFFQKYRIRFIADTVQNKRLQYNTISSGIISSARHIICKEIPNVFLEEGVLSFQAWKESFSFSDGLTSNAICVYFVNNINNEKLEFFKHLLTEYKFYKLILVLCGADADICIRLINESIPVTYVVKSCSVLSELKHGILIALAELNYSLGNTASHVIAYQSDKAKGNGCTLECRIDSSNQIVRASLREILENSKCWNSTFIQVNKSTLINMDYILNIEPSFNEVHMVCSYDNEGSSSFHIGRTYMKNVRKMYEEMLGARTSFHK